MVRKRFLVMFVLLAVATIFLSWSTALTSAAVVNIDVEAAAGSDSNHVGDDGPLSTPGGTVWNSVDSGVDAADLVDEFSVATPLDIKFLAPAGGVTFSDPGINNLQDSGTMVWLQITDLLPRTTYELAAYVGFNGGFVLKDANGEQGHFFGDPAADGWSLPGTEGNGGDYFRVSGVVPYDVGGGVYGIEIHPDGAMTGIQITGAVPEPSGMILLCIGSLMVVVSWSPVRFK